MTTPNFADRRSSTRKRLTGLMPGRVVTADDRRDVRCQPIDISRDGLGVLIAEQLPIGLELKLIVGEREIGLRVCWAQPDFGKQNLYRYGLAAVEAGVDLEKIFGDAGCLREDGGGGLMFTARSSEPIKQVKLYSTPSKSRKPQRIHKKSTRTRYF